MDRSFADTLATLSVYFPESLASSYSFADLLHVAEHFPALSFKMAGFESKLWTDVPSLDLALCISNNSLRPLSDAEKSFIIRQELVKGKTWRNIRDFVSDWLKAESELGNRIHFIWFEFDLDGNLSENLLPAIFLNIDGFGDQPEPARTLPGSKPIELGDISWVKNMIERLQGKPVSAKTMQNLLLCQKHLCPGSEINYLGFMASRSADILRVNVTGLSGEQLIEYLYKLESTALIEKVKGFLDCTRQYWDYLVLALDVGQVISPKIGIEFRLHNNEIDLSAQHRWHPFLDHLVEQDLCTDAKRDGLVNWSGKSREIFDPVLFRFVVHRYIHYLKAVFEPGYSVKMKGYFSLIFLNMV